MNNFTYEKASDQEAAVRSGTSTPGASYLGGGTNLVDLMRENLAQPGHLIDVSGLSRTVEETADGGLRVGAAVSNTELANDPRVKSMFPLLSQAILHGASGQIRNMATVGGNLLQRTRCRYFYDQAFACNKRCPGSGCDALEGMNRMHAILGSSPLCIATHPSDMAVALTALDAVVHLQGAEGTREMRLEDFYRLPGSTPELDTNLRPGELITAVSIPACDFARRSIYLKVRDRSSYAFALVSVAAAISLEGETFGNVRMALGGVAHMPWRARAAEKSLCASPANLDSFERAAERELAPAVGQTHNRFKIPLARQLMVSALEQLVEGRHS